jgi:hypothetical protein
LAQTLLGPRIAADGSARTVAVVVANADLQPSTVTVTLYWPDASVVAKGIWGFCSLDVNPFGPVQV